MSLHKLLKQAYTSNATCNIALKVLNICDIQLLTTKGIGRANNNENNKKREDILSKIFELPETYMENPIYGDQWKSIHDKWKNAIQMINYFPYDRFEISQKGGRCYHYDFSAKYFKDDLVIDEKYIEFKHNCSRIDKLPQFLSLSTKCDFTDISYAEFYYDNYLPEYIKLDPILETKKPDKETYIKYIYGTNYDAHPFFRMLYTREDYSKKDKHTIVNKSIEQYLTQFGCHISLDRLTEKMLKSQANKYYMLWDLTNFHTDKFVEDDLILIENEGIKNKNTIVLKSMTCQYHLLLRWRNHKGILLPAWQISIKNRTPKI
jgi:hypothetical protein